MKFLFSCYVFLWFDDLVWQRYDLIFKLLLKLNCCWLGCFGVGGSKYRQVRWEKDTSHFLSIYLRQFWSVYVILYLNKQSLIIIACFGVFHWHNHDITQSIKTTREFWECIDAKPSGVPSSFSTFLATPHWRSRLESPEPHLSPLVHALLENKNKIQEIVVTLERRCYLDTWISYFL